MIDNRLSPRPLIALALVAALAAPMAACGKKEAEHTEAAPADSVDAASQAEAVVTAEQASQDAAVAAGAEASAMAMSADPTAGATTPADAQQPVEGAMAPMAPADAPAPTDGHAEGH